MCLIFRRSLQIGESLNMLRIKQVGEPLTYFSLTISCHRPELFSRYHHHLQSKLTFIFQRFLMPSPRPPLFLDLQIFLPLYKMILLFQAAPLPEEFCSTFVHPFNHSFRQEIHRHVINYEIDQTRID
jgi:hypothetical protein